MIAKFNDLNAFASAALRQYLPAKRDDDWLSSVVDSPRYNWDWEALEQGYFAPLHEWAALHDGRIRPIFSAMLIDALGGDYRRHSDLLAALELYYLSSVMLDDLRNGRDLASSKAERVNIPLPVWVTVAYNTRQLAPVLIMRQCSSLEGPQRNRLAHRFARFLFQQGIGSTLDLWGSEQEVAHLTLEHFITHLSLYVGTLSFGLACDVASAAVGLDADKAILLTRAGTEIGVALRLGAVAEGRDQDVVVAGRRVREQRIRWTKGILPENLLTVQNSLVDSAITRAAQVHPAAAEALSTFWGVVKSNGGGGCGS